MSNAVDLALHPLELPRIANYRDYGFDKLDDIVFFASKQIDAHDQKPFAEVFENDKKFLLLTVTSFPNATTPFYDVELEVGFIDFQDQQKVIDSGVHLRLFETNKHWVLIKATDKSGKSTSDIEYVLTQITNGDYLQLAEKAA